MWEAYATSLSAFSGGHNQLSSTTPVTSSSPAPRTGIPNSSVAGTRPTFVPPPPPKTQEGAFQLSFFGEKILLLWPAVIENEKKRWSMAHTTSPNDLIIITAMRRPYWQNGQQKRGQLTNVYFHC